MKIIGYLFLLIALIFGITFSILNAESVHVNYYFGSYNLPLSLLLACTLIFGIIIGLCVGLWIYIQQKHTNYQLRKRIKLVEKEISNLRTIPLKDIN